jgi:hypothetical protein
MELSVLRVPTSSNSQDSSWRWVGQARRPTTLGVRTIAQSGHINVGVARNAGSCLTGK